jgi:hypothetical protein
MLGGRRGAPDAPQCEHCQRPATTQCARYGQQKCQLITARVLTAKDKGLDRRPEKRISGLNDLVRHDVGPPPSRGEGVYWALLEVSA